MYKGLLFFPIFCADFEVSLGVVAAVGTVEDAGPTGYAVPSFSNNALFPQATSVVEGAEHPPSGTKDNGEFVAPELTIEDAPVLEEFGVAAAVPTKTTS